MTTIHRLPSLSKAPIVPCHPDMRPEALRALVKASRDAEVLIASLQRGGLELGLDVFARRVAGLESCLTEARQDLERAPR